jgi:opacity protein-like surface antigen
MFASTRTFAASSALAAFLALGAVTPAVWADPSQLGGSSIDAGKVSLGGRGTFFDSRDSDQEDWYGGGQLRMYLPPTLALEASADYRQSDFGANEVDVFPVQASVLFYLFPGSPVTPFLLAGPGWYFTHVKGPGIDDTQHRFGLHAGGGLQFFINKYWSIDSTYRYVWVKDVEAQSASLQPTEYRDSGSMITAALNLHF